MVVEHHPPQLQRLDVVLVQHEGLLEALHGRLKVSQLSGPRKDIKKKKQKTVKYYYIYFKWY